ncbi:alcohol dehydrogenase [Pseudoclavibacter sp. RFBG4]|uniref:aldo/keto reductase n=1 Tax=Pseudoclavibacter sp. RFBG4 TaxID=2080575 RepID=UPI000CE8507F|nr:aldo/keto reductase [Pseudoclavibacter sp. RFBG4]PPG30819.1 alcohol dehydrogenase [Pseudoclavibacter sp. RFBG4]
MTTQLSPARRALGGTLSVSPVALGGNVFGWTADRDESFAILDAYVEAGGNFIDTADVYSAWIPGNSGAESETIIGEWLRSRGRPEDLVIATKVAQFAKRPGLSADNVRAAVDDSLERLGVERIDLYYAHRDDPDTPIAETAAVFSELVDAGKITAIGVSNYSAPRLREWLAAVENGRLHQPTALQPEYNLLERDIEGELLPLAREAGIGVVPYFALAHGFLTGKYRRHVKVESARAGSVEQYRNDHGYAIADAVAAIAKTHDAQPGTVALAWLAAQPGVVAPIASARTAAQLPLITDAFTLKLSDDELKTLDRVSAKA